MCQWRQNEPLILQDDAEGKENRASKHPLHYVNVTSHYVNVTILEN